MERESMLIRWEVHQYSINSSNELHMANLFKDSKFQLELGHISINTALVPKNL